MTPGPWTEELRAGKTGLPHQTQGVAMPLVGPELEGPDPQACQVLECVGPPGGLLTLPGSEEPGSSTPSAGRASAVWPLPQTPSVNRKKNGSRTGAILPTLPLLALARGSPGR